MTNYQPPPGPPPPDVQYAPPPGLPPSEPDAVQYPPPSSAPPADADPSEPPPPYTKTAPTQIHDTSDPNLAPIPDSILSSAVSARAAPLDPPPACFSRPTPPRIRTHAFAPFRVPSVSAQLADGFRPLYAGDRLASHGVAPEDWAEFLVGVRVAARRAADPPPAMNLPLGGIGGGLVAGLTGRGFAGRQYDRAFVKSPVEEAKALVAVWQESAFERRKLRVTLLTRADEGGTKREGYDLLVEAL